MDKYSKFILLSDLEDKNETTQKFCWQTFLPTKSSWSMVGYMYRLQVHPDPMNNSNYMYLYIHFIHPFSPFIHLQLFKRNRKMAFGTISLTTRRLRSQAPFVQRSSTTFPNASPRTSILWSSRSRATTSGYGTESSSRTLTRLPSSLTSPLSTGPSIQPSWRRPCSAPSLTRRSFRYASPATRTPACPSSTPALRTSSTPTGFPWAPPLLRHQALVSHMICGGRFRVVCCFFTRQSNV